MATTKKETPVKKEVVKKEVKAEKVEAVAEVKAPAVKPAAKSSGFSVPVYSLLGKEAGSLDLPKTIFGAEINKPLLSQAIRVYMNNQKGHHSHTKTRGQVEGSTRKIYNQKGTGRARHGGIRTPLFVGGGIALGPKYRKTILDLPKKMKKAALISALSQKLLDKSVFALSGLEKATGKTSEISKFLKGFGRKSILIVSEKGNDMAVRAVQNIKSINLITADEVNTFEVIKAQSLVFTKGAVEALEKRILKIEAKEAKAEKKETN